MAMSWLGESRARALFVLSIGTLALPIATALTASAASATPVDEARTVPAGEYSWVLLYSGTLPEDMEINITWNSSTAIDVWLMDRRQWDRYEAGLTFTADVAQSGILGTIRLIVEGERLVNGSMYVVLDNTERGPTAPPLATQQYSASVTVRGETWRPDPVYNFDPNAGLWLAAIAGAIIMVPLLFLAFVVIRKVRRRDRHKSLKQELKDGRLVGQAPAARRPAVQVGPVYPQPPYGGPFAAPQVPTSTAARRCPSCGAPVPAQLAFCTQCGGRA